MKCPRCSADVAPGNGFCGNCGQPMPETDDLPPLDDLPSDELALCCAKCGAGLTPGDDFCGICGEPVNSSEAGQSPSSPVPPLEAFAPSHRTKPAWMWLLLGAGMMCVLCAAAVIAVRASPSLSSAISGFLERTATQLQPPTEEATSAPTASSPVMPTATSNPTATPSLTLAPSPTPTESGLRAAFVNDVTIPDNTVLEPGCKFDKTWRVKNSGSHSWPVGVRLVYISGEILGQSMSNPLKEEVAPGEEVEMTIPMTAPSEPGVYKGSWQMRTSEGQFFGAEFFVVIQVEGAGPTPTGTGTAGTPTATPAVVPLQFEHAWNGNWIGIENRGVWAKAKDGHQYVAEMALVATEESLDKIESCLPSGRRARVIVRRQVGWVACTTDVCQEHSQSDDGQITNQLYLAPAAWSSLVTDHLSGGWQATTQNPYYDDVQAALFEPIGRIPDTPCIVFRFTMIE